MVTLSFVPFRSNTIWRRFWIPHVFYEKQTTVITYYSRFSKATPCISSLENIFIPTHAKHTYTEIFTPTRIHVYTIHTQPHSCVWHFNKCFLRGAKYMYLQEWIYYVQAVDMDTHARKTCLCTGELNIRHRLASGPARSWGWWLQPALESHRMNLCDLPF